MVTDYNAAEVIRVSIGSEPLQRIPAEVLKSSIIRRTARPVEFTESWSPAGGWHPLMKGVPRLKGTRFSLWRWLVPQVYQHTGRAIYLDADQVVLADIVELWNSLQHEHLAAVINAEGFFGDKIPEKNHVQTSVMVMDCGKCDWDAAHRFRDVEVGRMSYKQLMQAAWLPRYLIRELPPGWNHFGICNQHTKLLHWSHVASQPYRKPDHPTAHVFAGELRAAVEAGHVSQELIRDEIQQGHLHKHWRYAL